MCRLDKVFDGSALGPPPTLHRWRIDTAGPSLTFHDEVLSDRPADLPSIDRRKVGREYRHSWRVEVTPRTDTVEMRGVVHYDVRSGKEQRYDPGASRSSGEWLFVPRGDDEGDGYLVTYVYDAATDRQRARDPRRAGRRRGPARRGRAARARAVRLPRHVGPDDTGLRRGRGRSALLHKSD